ncbi:MAG: hypothetical protein OXG94_04580 [Bacteroidetes bacterium]|nr:hypothetical protein [Bacteroidota bacterium]
MRKFWMNLLAVVASYFAIAITIMVIYSARPKIPHIRNFERSWPSDVGLNSGSGFASFGEPVVLGDQIGQHSTTIALIRANWTHRCRESYDPIP